MKDKSKEVGKSGREEGRKLEHALYRGPGCTINIHKQTWSGHFIENTVLGSNL